MNEPETVRRQIKTDLRDGHIVGGMYCILKAHPASSRKDLFKYLQSNKKILKSIVNLTGNLCRQGHINTYIMGTLQFYIN